MGRVTVRPSARAADEVPAVQNQKSRLSCRYTTCAFGLAGGTDRRHIKLPSIGLVRTHESTRKLAGRVEAGTARIRSATISFSRGRWFVSFSVEVQQTRDVAAASAVVVGVDLGLTHLAALSTPVVGISDKDGMVANPDQLEHVQRALKRLQRQAARRHGPDKRTKSAPSKRWSRTQSRIARLHGQVANERADGLHKLTTALSKRCGVIVIEDLNVSGMIANHRLARRITSAGWGELRRQLEYKTRWRGVQLAVADRFFPSSKTCSMCGAVKAKLRLSQRTYCCEVCGMRMDRDLNAARNMAALVASRDGDASSSSCGATKNEPAGNSRKTSQAGREYCHGKPLGGNAA